MKTSAALWRAVVDCWTNEPEPRCMRRHFFVQTEEGGPPVNAVAVNLAEETAPCAYRWKGFEFIRAEKMAFPLEIHKTGVTHTPTCFRNVSDDEWFKFPHTIKVRG